MHAGSSKLFIYLQINKIKQHVQHHALFSANEQKGQVRKGPFPPLNSAVAPSMMSFKTPFRCLCLLSFLSFSPATWSPVSGPVGGGEKLQLQLQADCRPRARVGGWSWARVRSTWPTEIL